MKQFKRITTENVEMQERICMMGTLYDGEVMRPWFT